jgi:hypothetical protein
LVAGGRIKTKFYLFLKMKRSNGILEIVEGIAKDVPTDRHAAGPCRRTRYKMDERTCATTTTTTAVARAKNVQDEKDKLSLGK